MKTMNWKSFRIILFIVTLFVFSSWVNLYAADYKIRVANPVAADHSQGRMAMLFKEDLEKATGGRIAVEVHHAGALGKIRENLEMIRMGTLETTISGVAHVQRHVAQLGITVLPYLWKDTKTLFEVLDGPLGKELEKRMLAMGYYNLGFVDNGFRHVSNNRKPIRSVEDMKGLKIRTLPTPVHIAFFKALGASPTPMDFVELFEALRTGVVDAQENPPAMTYTAKFYEVQKFYSLTSHVNEVGTFVLSKIFYDKLPKDLQNAVDAAALKAKLWQRAENEKDNQKYVKELDKAGMKVNTIPDEDFKKFRTIALQVYPDALKDLGKDAKELTDRFVEANK